MKWTGRGRRMVIKPQLVSRLQGGAATKIADSYKPSNGFSKSQRQLHEVWGSKNVDLEILQK